MTETTRSLRRWVRMFFLIVSWALALGVALWTFGALSFDFPVRSIKAVVAWAYLVVIVVLVFSLPTQIRKLGAVFASFLLVLAWWFTLRPSNDRQWLPEVAKTPWAEVSGDKVTLHNIRDFRWRTETDFTPNWETRTVDLSRLTAVDITIGYWGSPYMAHPIVSFEFSDSEPVCFSIETRKEVGESYSAIGGIYRQFELAYICATERDVLRLRTNVRPGEDLYLYRLVVTPEEARLRFMDYIQAINQLRANPRWYNAATTNCTTSIRSQHEVAKRAKWDWRLLVNGFMDEMMYERGQFAGGLPFAELKKRAHINDAAKAAGEAEDYSRVIRAGRPGFPRN